MHQYKNKSTEEQVVIGHGIVKPGAIIQSRSPIENPNFELVSSNPESTVVGTEAPQPNAVIEAQPVQPTQPETEVK